MKTVRKFLALFRKEKLDADMFDEMRLHLEQRARENIAAGLSPEEARYAALRKFGGVEQAKEIARDQRGWRWVEHLSQDVRYGARALRKSPGFTSAVMLTLALGIGANTAIFTLVNALLLRSLPVSEPTRLVRLTAGDAKFRDEAFPYAFFQRLRDAAPSRTDLAAVETRTTRRELGAASLGVVELEPVNAQAVSGNFFSTLGVVAPLGRVLTTDDDRGEVVHAVVVLGHAFWQRRFGADPGVIGKDLQLDKVTFTIVGVAPPGFRGLEQGVSPDLWWPVQMLPAVEPGERDLVRALPRAGEWLTVFGRLRNGVTGEQARAELNAFYQAQLTAEADTPGAQWDETRRHNFLSQTIELRAAGVGTSLGRQFARLFGVFALAAGVVLLIACANVAGLLLARGATRAREFAVRSALGAARGRLVRQLITEGLLLALLGGALGVFFARWGTDALANYFPQHAQAFDLALDGRGLFFTTIVSVASGLFFGLAPALRFSRIDLATAMKNQSGPMAGGGRLRLNHTLVVAQIALSFVLLAGAGLFLRTLRNLHSLDLGFRTENVVLFSLEFPRGYDAGQHGDVHTRLLHALDTFPGVRAASVSGAGVMSGDIIRTRFAIDGYTPGPDEDLRVSAVVVGPRFFETMRIPLLRGRELTWADGAATGTGAGPQPVVISESMARRYFAGTDPIGHTIRHGGRGQPFTIIGVAKDTKYQNLREKTPLEYYLPYAGSLLGFPMSVHISTTSEPAALEANLRQIVSQIDPRLTLKDMRTMEETIDRTLVQERAIAELAGFFSVFALTLASLGLYGVLSYGVTQRSREIGVRMALGAHARDILRLVVHQGLAVTLSGCALGLVAAAALTRLVGDLLYGVAAGDPAMLLTTVAVLIPVALLACWLPARRAAKVDPIVALRCE